MSENRFIAHAVRYKPPSFGAQTEVKPVIISMPRPAEWKDVVEAIYRFSSGAAVDCELGYLNDNGEFVPAPKEISHAA